MPNTGVTTLATIRTAAQRRADMENSTFIATAEWTAMINASYTELFDLLVQKYGNDYYSAIDANGNGFQITTNGTSEMFALPDGSTTYKMPDNTTAPAFYKLLGVEMQLTASLDWVTLKPFAFIERNAFAVPNMQATRGYRSNLRYRVMGNIGATTPTQYLWLKPLPMSGQIVRVWYVPRLTALSADGDTVDGVSGWEEYIVIDAALKAKEKEESDQSTLLVAKQGIIKRIEEASENRDAGSPAVVGDARKTSGWGGDADSGDWG